MDVIMKTFFFMWIRLFLLNDFVSKRNINGTSISIDIFTNQKCISYISWGVHMYVFIWFNQQCKNYFLYMMMMEQFFCLKTFCICICKKYCLLYGRYDENFFFHVNKFICTEWFRKYTKYKRNFNFNRLLHESKMHKLH